MSRSFESTFAVSAAPVSGSKPKVWQVFLLTPPNVEVTDDEKERLRDRGLYRR